MPMLDRRRFLVTSAAAAASFRAFAQAKPTSAVSLTPRGDTPGPLVPTSFIGLSYETKQLADPGFFSAANTGLIEQFRALTPQGVLRLGGNTSDIGWWKPTPDTPRPALHINATGEAGEPGVPGQLAGGGGEPTAALTYAITPEAVRNLRAFLDATGWSCLYGINLGTNTSARAADEAKFVAATLGTKLEYFQLGNEPDLFSRHLRDPKSWTANAFFDEWLAAAQAIRTAVHGARFGLPDTAGNPEWYASVVDRLLALQESPCAFCADPTRACGCVESNNPGNTRPIVTTLSHHYYVGGPPANPAVNIDLLLQHSDRVDTLAHDIRAAAARLTPQPAPEPNAHGERVPDYVKQRGLSPPAVHYRMTEGNTCYRGGKPGVSDVFASALWAADYALLLASYGYAGLNLHGGGGKAVADSLGGTLPGELLLPDPKAPHARPFYTPIAYMESVAGAGRYVAQPVFYGLQFAQRFAGARMLALDFAPGVVNATAYAAQLSTGQKIIAVINKDRSQPLHIDAPGYTTALILSAPSLTSAAALLTEPAGNRETSTVPPFTAVLLETTL